MKDSMSFKDNLYENLKRLFELLCFLCLLICYLIVLFKYYTVLKGEPFIIAVGVYEGLIILSAIFFGLSMFIRNLLNKSKL